MRISYNVKEKMVELAGACFWYWSSFHGFLDSSGIPKSLYDRYPRESFNKYHVMRNILGVLEDGNDTEKMNSIVSNFYRLANAVDRDKRDNARAKPRALVVFVWRQMDSTMIPSTSSLAMHPE